MKTVKQIDPDDKLKEEAAERFSKSLKEANEISKINGNDKLTLEEINKIIASVRKSKE